MANKKYQIFISATYDDLKEERQSAIKAIWEMGHVPVGMEMFSAADEEQWEIIKKTIDECDYYIVIVAHRYGSLDGKISFTEKEYDYAMSAQVPVLGFVVNDKTKWDPKMIDRDPVFVTALNNFKQKVKNKPVGFWKNAEDLSSKISIALGKQFNTTPRPGWVRAVNEAGPGVTAEISRLSNENASLRQQLKNQSNEKDSKLINEYNNLVDILSKNTVILNFRKKDNSGWTDGLEEKLYKIFWDMAPEIMIEASSKSIALLFGVLYNTTGEEIYSEWPIPPNALRSWIADFVALGIVEPSSIKHHLKDENEYWTLSSKGKEFYNHLRRLRLQETSVKEDLTESQDPKTVEK